MKTYIVEVKEIHRSDVEVTADSKVDAIYKVQEGEGKEVSKEYLYTADIETWDVFEKN